MNGQHSHHQEGSYYIDTGFPCTVTESFMDLFHETTYVQPDAMLAGEPRDQVIQGNAYWPMMHSTSYRYDYSGPAHNSYFRFNHAYEGRRRGWDSHTLLNTDELPSLDWHEAEGDEETSFVSIEERIPTQQASSNPEAITSPQVFWQDGIDPDSMTYEELLDLGEAVGTQSRGLSKDIILLLPVSKYKCSFFSRKKTQRERCVICQMDYKRGDRQMTLPCRHIYHASCATKWLNINKACPVCSVEVSSDIARH